MRLTFEDYVLIGILVAAAVICFRLALHLAFPKKRDDDDHPYGDTTGWQ